MRREMLLAATLLLGGCEIDRVGIPRTEARVAMHAVLSASAPTQVVLLERTRNGSVALVAPPFDLADPVVSDAGIAEMGATVRMTTPSGQTLFAREDNLTRGDGKGGGIYRFTLPGSALERGGTYRLTVSTINNEVLTAETTVPAGAAAMTATPLTFDRSRDTLTLEWPAARGARSYFVRIETPYGPRAFFTEGTSVRLAGALRNIDVEELPRVFIPGFPQAVTVSAVDSNYYDWYRSRNDVISGAGLVSRVQGGLGVFGSLVRLRYEGVNVVAPQTEPVAGRFELVGTPAELTAAFVLQLDLYVESAAGRSDQPDALSGRYIRRPTFEDPGCGVCGLLGTAKDGRVELELLREWSPTETRDRFIGELRGDTLVGTFRGLGGNVRFVKRR
jgi:hypothetical protein